MKINHGWMKRHLISHWLRSCATNNWMSILFERKRIKKKYGNCKCKSNHRYYIIRGNCGVFICKIVRRRNCVKWLMHISLRVKTKSVSFLFSWGWKCVSMNFPLKSNRWLLRTNTNRHIYYDRQMIGASSFPRFVWTVFPMLMSWGDGIKNTRFDCFATEFLSTVRICPRFKLDLWNHYVEKLFGR